MVLSQWLQSRSIEGSQEGHPGVGQIQAARAQRVLEGVPGCLALPAPWTTGTDQGTGESSGRGIRDPGASPASGPVPLKALTSLPHHGFLHKMGIISPTHKV